MIGKGDFTSTHDSGKGRIVPLAAMTVEQYMGLPDGTEIIAINIDFNRWSAEVTSHTATQKNRELVLRFYDGNKQANLETTLLFVLYPEDYVPDSPDEIADTVTTGEDTFTTGESAATILGRTHKAQGRPLSPPGTSPESWATSTPKPPSKSMSRATRRSESMAIDCPPAREIQTYTKPVKMSADGLRSIPDGAEVVMVEADQMIKSIGCWTWSDEVRDAFVGEMEEGVEYDNYIAFYVIPPAVAEHSDRVLTPDQIIENVLRERIGSDLEEFEDLAELYFDLGLPESVQDLHDLLSQIITEARAGLVENPF